MMGRPSAQKQHYTDATGGSQGLPMNSLRKPIDATPDRNLWSVPPGIYGIGMALRSMHHNPTLARLFHLASCSLLALLLPACGAIQTFSSEPTQTAAKPTISQEAQAILAQAAADVEYARSKFALWTTAETALNAARDAAAAGDSAGVIKHAGYASSQVRLGIAQLDYPTTERK